MKNTFAQLKKKILEKAKKNNACQSEYKKASHCRSKTKFLEIISNNICWCYYETDTVTISDLRFYTQKELKDVGLIISGSYSVGYGKFFALGNSTVKALDNSTVYSYNGKHNQKNKSIVRDMNSKKLYVIKDKFEIVEL